MTAPVSPGGSPAELADLIDELMAQGSGHVNIIYKDDAGELTVDTVKSTDCGTGAAKGACCQPTEFDDDDE